MRSSISICEREHLFRAILSTISRWPEKDRKVFIQARYSGQSPRSISGSLGLDIKETLKILKRCDLRLQKSLRKYRAAIPDQPAQTLQCTPSAPAAPRPGFSHAEAC